MKMACFCELEITGNTEIGRSRIALAFAHGAAPFWLTFPGDEPGNPGVDDPVESIACRDSLDLRHRDIQERGYFKTFANVVRIFRGREDSRAALKPPRDANLSCGLSHLSGNFS